MDVPCLERTTSSTRLLAVCTLLHLAIIVRVFKVYFNGNDNWTLSLWHLWWAYINVCSDQCNQWYRAKWEKLENHFPKKNSPLSYICSKCGLDENKMYNFDATINRLGAAMKNSCIKNEVKLESILMRNNRKRWKWSNQYHLITPDDTRYYHI